MDERIEKVILPEEMAQKSIDELIYLYRQGYTLDNYSLPGVRRRRTPPKRFMGNVNVGDIEIENMLDGKEVTIGDVTLGIISIMVGALIYYKLGKWESKKLGWD